MSSIIRRNTVLALLALPLVSLTGCGGSNPYQGMESAEVYAIGLERDEKGDWKNAIRVFDRYLITFANADRVADACLMMAESYYNQRDFLIACSEFQRFLDRHASHPEAPTAALGICRSLAALSPNPERDQSYTNDAIGICRNVVVDYAGTPQSMEAATLANDMRTKLAEKEFLNAEFYFRRKLFDSAIKYYEFVVQLYSETEYAPQALKGIYWSNLYIGYEDLAEEARQRLLEEYPDSPAAQELRTDGNGS